MTSSFSGYLKSSSSSIMRVSSATWKHNPRATTKRKTPSLAPKTHSRPRTPTRPQPIPLASFTALCSGASCAHEINEVAECCCERIRGSTLFGMVSCTMSSASAAIRLRRSSSTAAIDAGTTAFVAPLPLPDFCITARATFYDLRSSSSAPRVRENGFRLVDRQSLTLRILNAVD
jgi:hypothetical protein